MEFTNQGEPVMIRIGKASDCSWLTIIKGESVELSKSVGLSMGLIPKTTEGKIGNKKVETKQISVPQKEVQYTPDNLFFEELIEIKGIGKKTASDIVKWGTKEKLIEVVAVGGSLPFRDDIEEILRRKYG